MSRIEENKNIITEVQKKIDARTYITQEYNVSLIRDILAEISISLAVIADSMSEEVEVGE